MKDRAAWDDKYVSLSGQDAGLQLVRDVRHARIARVLQGLITSPCRILEAGSGTGRIVNFLALTTGSLGTGVDFSMKGNVLAAQTAAVLGLPSTFVCADLVRLPFCDAAFDVVFSDSVVEHLPDPQAAIIEVSRVVRPGGLVVVTTPNRLRPDGWDLYRWLARPAYLQRSFTPWELGSLFRRAGLTVEGFFGETALLLRSFRLLFNRFRSISRVAPTNAPRLRRSRGLYVRLESFAERILPPYLGITIGVVARKRATK